MAAGEYETSYPHFRTLLESWNGTRWSVVPSPNLGANNYLRGVSCTSATACTTAGSYTNGGADMTLIESWNGTSWSIVPSPNPGTSSNDLAGVSCISPTACTAAGYYNPNASSTYRTLIESWNGTRWSVVPSPSPGTGGNQLEG